MVKQVSNSDFHQAFEDYGRSNQFSPDGLDQLYDYYEDLDENWELDVVAICCDWSEYDSAKEAYEACFGADDEAPDPNGEAAEEEDEADAEERMLDRLRENTTAYLLDNGHVLVRDF